MLPQLGKLLIILGVVLVAVGVLFIFADRLPFLGKLPGDVVYKKGDFTLYVPIVTMLAASILLSILINLLHR